MIDMDLDRSKKRRITRQSVMKNQWKVESNPLDHTEHEVCELICLKCFDRWIGVFPKDSLLKDMVCECGAKGAIIKTGQTIEECDAE